MFSWPGFKSQLPYFPTLWLWEAHVLPSILPSFPVTLFSSMNLLVSCYMPGILPSVRIQYICNTDLALCP